MERKERRGRGPTIRLARLEDAIGIAAIYRPVVEGTSISFELEPPGAVEMARRIDATLATHPWLVCASGEEVWGYAYATPFRARPAYAWTVETSVYVGPDRRRCGVGRGLAVALLEVLRLQGFRRAIAGIALPNPASVALHESLGYQSVGVFDEVGRKHEAWHAVGFWDLALVSTAEAPAATRSVADVQGTGPWRDALAKGEAALRRDDG